MRLLTRTALFTAAALAAALPVDAAAQRSAYGIDWSCGYRDGADFVRKIKQAYEDDLSCLAGAGFLEETLPRIGGAMDDERQRLKILLSAVLKADAEAEAVLVKDLDEGTDEAALWLLIARGERGLPESTRRNRMIAVNLFASLPPWARARFSTRLADALLAEGDTRSALTLATALRAIATEDDEIAKAAMIHARVVEGFGDVNKAVALYDEVTEIGSERLVAEAELRKIALMWRTGYVQTDEAVAVLRELVTVWRGESLGTGIALALARAYYFDQQIPQALRLLFSVYGSNAPEEVREEVRKRIVSHAEDLFVRRTDPSTVGDLMDVYKLVRPLMAEEGAFWLGDLKLAEVLLGAGLATGAEKLLQGADALSVAEAGGAEASLLAAKLNLAFGNRDAVLAHIAQVPRQGLTPKERLGLAVMEAEGAKIEELAALLVPGVHSDVVAVVSRRAWAAQDYGLFARARSFEGSDTTWREPAAAYLSRGQRITDQELVSARDPRRRVLGPTPKPAVHHADDLRALLAPSAEVANLAVGLTQIGHDLSEAASEPAEQAGGDALTKDEKTR
jgi:hypothetical protein